MWFLVEKIDSRFDLHKLDFETGETKFHKIVQGKLLYKRDRKKLFPILFILLFYMANVIFINFWIIFHYDRTAMAGNRTFLCRIRTRLCVGVIFDDINLVSQAMLGIGNHGGK